MNALVRDLGQEVDNAVDDVLERVTLAELVRQYHERETFSYIIQEENFSGLHSRQGKV